MSKKFEMDLETELTMKQVLNEIQIWILRNLYW